MANQKARCHQIAVIHVLHAQVWRSLFDVDRHVSYSSQAACIGLKVQRQLYNRPHCHVPFSMVPGNLTHWQLYQTESSSVGQLASSGVMG